MLANGFASVICISLSVCVERRQTLFRRSSTDVQKWRQHDGAPPVSPSSNRFDFVALRRGQLAGSAHYRSGARPSWQRCFCGHRSTGIADGGGAWQRVGNFFSSGNQLFRRVCCRHAGRRDSAADCMACSRNCRIDIHRMGRRVRRNCRMFCDYGPSDGCDSDVHSRNAPTAIWQPGRYPTCR